MTTTPTLWKSLTQVNTSDAPVEGSGGAALQHRPHIVGLDDGGYVVVWTDASRVHNPNGEAVVAQRYDVLGEKVGGEVDVSFNSGRQFSQSAIRLSDGKIAIAFRDIFFEASDLYVSVYDASFNFLRLDVLDDTPATTHSPSLTALAGGGYAASYTVQGEFPASDVVGRVVSSTGVVGPQFDIASGPDLEVGRGMATLSDGNIVVVLGRGPSDEVEDVMFGIFWRAERMPSRRARRPWRRWPAGASSSCGVIRPTTLR